MPRKPKPPPKPKLPYGQGSAYQLKDGSWAGSVAVAQPDGTRKRVYRRGQTADAVLAALAALRDAPATEAAVSGNDTLAEWLERWLRDYATPAVRSGTLRAYTGHVAILSAALGGTRLTDLRGPTIQRLYAARLAAGLSPRYIHVTHAVLRKALQQAVQLDLLDRNPVDHASPPRIEREEQVIFTVEQTARLLAALETNTGRLAAVVTLLATTALRLSEALGLRWSDIDLDAGHIWVRGQIDRTTGRHAPPKSSRGIRDFDLMPRAVAALRAHKARQTAEQLVAGWEPSPFAFRTKSGRSWKPDTFYSGYRRILRDADLPYLHPHALRHAAASYMLAAGIPVSDVSKILGHSKASVTLDVYSHVIPGQSEAAIAALDSVLRRKSGA